MIPPSGGRTCSDGAQILLQCRTCFGDAGIAQSASGVQPDLVLYDLRAEHGPHVSEEREMSNMQVVLGFDMETESELDAVLRGPQERDARHSRDPRAKPRLRTFFFTEMRGESTLSRGVRQARRA